MPITTGDFPQYLEEATKKLKTALGELAKESIYPQFMQVGDANKFTERETDYENMAAVSLMPEQGQHPELSYSEGYSQSYTQHKWGGKVVITEDMIFWQKAELVADLLQQLKISTFKAKEIIGASYLEYGDTALASVPAVAALPIINSIGGDGQVLFFSAHTWKSGGATWRNRSVASDDLTESAIQTAYSVIRRWKDNTGAPLGVKMTGIVFPPDLRSKYAKVTLSDLEPSTANNAINVAPKLVGRKGIEYQWLSDTADWYIITDGSGKLQWKWGWQDKVKRGTLDPDTENQFIKVDFEVAHGALILNSLYKVG